MAIQLQRVVVRQASLHSSNNNSLVEEVAVGRHRNIPMHSSLTRARLLLSCHLFPSQPCPLALHPSHKHAKGETSQALVPAHFTINSYHRKARTPARTPEACLAMAALPVAA